jgi:hypothetical protein
MLERYECRPPGDPVRDEGEGLPTIGTRLGDEGAYGGVPLPGVEEGTGLETGSRSWKTERGGSSGDMASRWLGMEGTRA